MTELGKALSWALAVAGALFIVAGVGLLYKVPLWDDEAGDRWFKRSFWWSQWQ
jgi:hypothetical protein